MAKTRNVRISREERRERLIEAAREEFLAFGYQGARTKSIAERGGVAEALLYQHFGSKENLFEEAVVAPLKRTVEQLSAAGALSRSDDDALQRASTYFFVQQTLEAMVDSAALFGIVLFSNQSDGRAFYQKVIAPILDELIDLVVTNFDSWSHRPFNPELTVPGTLGMCWFLAVDASFRGRTLDCEAAAQQIVDLFFEGLSTSARGRDSAAAVPAPKPRRTTRR